MWGSVEGVLLQYCPRESLLCSVHTCELECGEALAEPLLVPPRVPDRVDVNLGDRDTVVQRPLNDLEGRVLGDLVQADFVPVHVVWRYGGVEGWKELGRWGRGGRGRVGVREREPPCPEGRHVVTWPTDRPLIGLPIQHACGCDVWKNWRKSTPRCLPRQHARGDEVGGQDLRYKAHPCVLVDRGEQRVPLGLRELLGVVELPGREEGVIY